MNKNSHFPLIIRTLQEFDGPFDAFRLTAENCDVLFASYPAGTSIEPHTHDTENVGVITEGELQLTMNGKSETFSVGDWYYVPAHQEHSASFDNDTSEIEFWFKTGP